MKNLKLEIRISKKTGKSFACLTYNLGYAVRVLTFDKCLCSEVSGYSLRELGELEVGIYDIKD